MHKEIVKDLLVKKLNIQLPTSASGWTEFYSSGKIDNWDLDGNLMNYGTYQMREADNIGQCYLEITWEQGPSNTECVTFSPTLDNQALVGCYVFDTNCLTECNTTSVDSWFAGVTILK